VDYQKKRIDIPIAEDIHNPWLPGGPTGLPGNNDAGGSRRTPSIPSLRVPKGEQRFSSFLDFTLLLCEAIVYFFYMKRARTGTYPIIVVIFSLLTLGCSIQKMAIRSTSGLFQYGIEAIYAEPDLQFAREAIAANLKLLEGFHRADPKNQTLLFMLTQGYASYSLAFLEDDYPERARQFYLRARDYGFQLLRTLPAFKKGIPTATEAFQERLDRLRREDVPVLFWTAFAWGGWINLSKHDPQAVYDLNLVKAMMQRVLELEEGYFFGAAHLFFGSVYGSLPPMLGGDPEKARAEFQRSLELSQNRFLMAYVYAARYYAATTLNEELFDRYLQQVLDAPDNILPGYELLTAVAKAKARRLLQQKEELF